MVYPQCSLRFSEMVLRFARGVACVWVDNSAGNSDVGSRATPLGGVGILTLPASRRTRATLSRLRAGATQSRLGL